MIYSLKGKVSYVAENTLVVDTGAVAFECICSTNTIYKLTDAIEATVLTYLQVRDDGMTLFGFADNAEKDLFIKLNSVSGIGPKIAIGILSSASVDALISAIANKNTKLLSSVKGLGAKSAERICLELKDKLSVTQGDLLSSINSMALSQSMDDAVECLIALGFNKTDAQSTVKMCGKPEMTAEEIVALSLKNLSR